MPDIREAKAFMKEVGLSDAQLDVLRRASRKYKDYHLNKNELYNGEVNGYGVMSATLGILRERGLIAQGHRISDETERNKLSQRAHMLIVEAWAVVIMNIDPMTVLKTEDGDILAWREVQSTLSVARGIESKLAENCLLITEAGRKIAADWEKVIGAVEE